MSNVLTVENLSVKFGSVEALKNISFTIPRGKIISLIGSNGAGKTTTLKAISGAIDQKDKLGNINFNGIETGLFEPYKMVELGLIHCPEGRGVFPNLNVYENLQLGTSSRPHANKHFKENLEVSFHYFPRLKERIKQQAGTLSGGEQQMLAIARALIAMPEVLLLDEPSLGLAPQVVKLIFNIITQINHEKNVSILLVEQNAKQALKISDYAYVLESGKISLEGVGLDLLENDDVKKIYLGEH